MVLSMMQIRKGAVVLALSLAGLGFIQEWEGTEQEAYLDVVGVPTVCSGSTRGVRLGQHFTLEECKERLKEDVGVVGRGMARCITAELTQTQYDALLSLGFNIGTGAMCKSTLVRKLNSGDCLGAAREFTRWDMAGGKHLRGLQNRRQAEQKEFLKGCYSE